MLNLKNALSALANDDSYEFVKNSLEFSYGQYNISNEVPTHILTALRENLDFFSSEKTSKNLINQLINYLGTRTDLQNAYKHYKTVIKPQVTYVFLQHYIQNVQEERANLESIFEVADIGCGNGLFAQALTDQIPDCIVTCTDTLSYEGLKAPNICFIQQTHPAILPFKDSSLDLVLLISMVHHIDSHVREAFFREVSRVLKEDGKVIIVEDSYSNSRVPKNNENNLNGTFLKIDPERRNETLKIIDWIGTVLIPGDIGMSQPFELHSMEEWESIFTTAGFNIVKSIFDGFSKGRFHLNPQAVFELSKQTVIEEYSSHPDTSTRKEK